MREVRGANGSQASGIGYALLGILRVGLRELLLARAITIFLGSESRGTRDNILPSHDYASCAITYDSLQNLTMSVTEGNTPWTGR